MKLSPLELSTLQSAGTSFLGMGTAVIWTATNVSDGQGGFTTTWAASGTVDCRLWPAGSGKESVIAAKLTSLSPWIITVPANTTISTANRVTIGARTFEVVSVQGAESWEIHRRIIAVEVA